MKFIYLIKAFDTERWLDYYPIAFETASEANAYCDAQSECYNIHYTYDKVHLGKWSDMPTEEVEIPKNIPVDIL